MDRITVLRAFVRLVEVGSFTTVAQELRVKQSTVSKWIAALEDELGVQLVDRTTRSQRVTDAGQRFYERACAIVADYDDALAELRLGSEALRGRIRLSLPVVFGKLFVVPLATRFLRQHKGVELEMVFGDRYARLVEEGFDLAIRVGIPVDSTLRSHKLGDGTRRLVASPGYLRSHGAPDSPKALEGHECLRHTDLQAPAVWRFTRGGKTQRVSVRGRVSANNSEATLSMARSGLGICLLASWMVDADVRAGRLVALLEDFTPPPAPVRALTPPGRHTPQHVRALIAHLREGLAPVLNASAKGAIAPAASSRAGAAE